MSIATVILNPANVEGYNDRVYCVGPFGNKIGFGSQQKRALNLVWALADKNLIKSGTKVAVIGGGIAGIMACSGLKGYGCIVTLYEEGEDVLQRQVNATHRLVHPSINAWPMINQLRSTTDYPFYDWFVGKCSTVIEKLKSDWDRNRDKYLRNFVNHAKVTKVPKPTNIEGPIKFIYQNMNPDTRSDVEEENYHEANADIVIIATGFGEEKIFSSADVNSYWYPDNVNHARAAKAKYRKLIVSGTGDGGLIDCARLAHKDFNNGKLTLRVIGDLRHKNHGPQNEEDPFSAHEDAIRKAEEKAKKMFDYLTSGKMDKISIQLEKDYLEIVNNFDGSTKKILDESLDAPERITLYGLTARPFSIEASPINKIILAHLLINHPSLYKQGALEEINGELFEMQNGIAETKLEPDFYICRHGAVAPITTMIEGFDAAAFRGKQSEIADILDISEYGHKDFLEHIDFEREHDTKKHAYAEARLELARIYSKKYFLQQPQPRAGSKTALAFGFVDNDNYRGSKFLTGGHDKDLFGVEVVLEEDDQEMLTAIERGKFL